MKKARILIIIPAYNEEANILNTYKKIMDYNKNNNTNYDVLVINDGSTDNTEMFLKEFNVPHIKLIENLGIGGAVQTGYKYAYENNYDIAVQFDGDGQHNVEYVKDIIDPIISGKYDLCIGSRFILPDQEGFKSSKARRIGIKMISSLIKIFTGKKIYDPTSGFRAINKDIIKDFSSIYPMEYPEPISYISLLRKNYKIKEVSVVMNERTGGKSSIHTWKNIYYMINVSLSIFIESIKRYKDVK